MERSRVTRARHSRQVDDDFKKLRIKNLLILVAIILAAAGVAALVGMKIHAGLQAREAEAAQGRAREMVEAGATLFGTTRQEVYARLGRPLRVDDSVVRTDPKRKGWEQIIYRIHYDGVVIEIQRLRTPGEPEREVLSTIAVTSSAHKLRYELGVGMYRSRVREVLGSPTREELSRDIYESDPVLQRQVRFQYGGDIVTAIEWRF